MIAVKSDGACLPNPGGVATFSFIIYKDGEKIHFDCGTVGEGPKMSNNVAEYAALSASLKHLLSKNMQSADTTVYSDSKLMVRQMQGAWKVHEGLYLKWYHEAKHLQVQFQTLHFTLIPREENTEADALTMKAYHEHLARHRRASPV